ncbi:phosphomethylpyrimidine synthase ThiC [bacterium]|nr:phosphomethylpyrimidine synthase ThiC [bacterium]MBU1753105.1 phosphomethylpyrimidine synthase ThiC [bacterium]
MSTQLELARKGEITALMQEVAQNEGVSPEFVMDGIAAGRIVIPNNINRKAKAVGIGKGLRTKVNASIGTSSDIIDLEMELEKARVAQQYGADTLMELSTGGDLDMIRQRVLKEIDLPVGNVPLYQAAIYSIREYGTVVKMKEDFIFEVMEKQLQDGLSFMAVHCGINTITLERLRKQGYRHGGMVSRGGAFMTAWMTHNEKENPLYSQFDRVVGLFKKYDAVLSLGNGMRAGAIHDSTDRAQIQELIINSELAKQAQDEGVQVIVEGPGHIPIDEIEANVILQKRLSNEAPFYMLGPITTDVAPGYDHVTAAIGAALSSAYGADFICYVTPPEHLALPYPEDVREGVTTARIAAHIGDMVKYKHKDRDLAMAHARREVNWEKQFELAITSEKAQEIYNKRKPTDPGTCTMCGEYCALKIVNNLFPTCNKI